MSELWDWFAGNLAQVIDACFQSLGAFARSLAEVTVQYVPLLEWEVKHGDMVWAELEVRA
jgi:hypothetical protein